MANRYLIVAPVIAGLSWILLLLNLFTLWLADGKPKYRADGGTIAYISLIGATYYVQFILGSCITAFFFVSTLVQFVIVHHSYIINEAMSTVNRVKPRVWADYLALGCGIVSSSALVLLSIFDAIRHPTFHWSMTLVFAFTAILCAVFNAIGVSTFRKLKGNQTVSFALKLLFIIISTGVLIAMIVLMVSCSTIDKTVLTTRCEKSKSIAAVLEWTLALLYFVFILTWMMDFSM